MTRAEFQERIGAAALGALEPGEQAEFEAHLASLPAEDPDRVELARAQAAVAGLAELLPLPAADEALWSRIATRARAERAAAGENEGAAGAGALASPAADERPGGTGVPRTGAGSGRAAAARWTERAGWTSRALALAACLAAIALGIERMSLARRLASSEAQLEVARAERAGLLGQLEAARRELAAAGVATDMARVAERDRASCDEERRRLRARLGEQVAALEAVQQPGSRIVALAAQAGAPYRASLVIEPGGHRAWLLSAGPGAPADLDLQLWLIRGDRKISAGLLAPPRGPDGAAGAPGDAPKDAGALAIDAALLAGGLPDAVAVTVEPRGGAAQPTGPIVLLARVPRA